MVRYLFSVLPITEPEAPAAPAAPSERDRRPLTHQLPTRKLSGSGEAPALHSSSAPTPYAAAANNGRNVAPVRGDRVRGGAAKRVPSDKVIISNALHYLI